MSCPDNQGGEGASGPSRALMSWMFSFEDGPNATTGDRFVIVERRVVLGKQRRDYIRDRPVPMHQLLLLRTAEDTRFELVRGLPQHAFQACALGL